MEFRPGGLLLALTLASILALTPTLALTANGDFRLPGSTESAVICIFGTSWVLWLAGTTVTVATAMRRGTLHGATLRILGLILGLLHPMAAFAVSLTFQPSPASEPNIGDAIGLSVGAGILQLAFGWFGGWVIWRLGFPSLAAGSIAASRGWHALKRFRFAFAFLLLPLILGLGVTMPSRLSGSAEAGSVAVALGAFPVAAVVTLVVFGALRAFQPYVTRGNCCFVGAIAGLAFPAMTDPFLSERATGSVVEQIALLFCIGSVLVLLGLLGGWLIWKLGIASGMQPVSSKGAEAALPSVRYRRWQDLHAGRLSLGLCFGPIALTLLLILIWVVDASMTTEEMIPAAIGLLILLLAWTLIACWIYLLVVARPRQRISRFECLLLGVVAADLFPLVLASLIFSFEGWEGVVGTLGESGPEVSHIVAVLIVIEILFAATGLLGGYLLWRFGVRPAPVPHPDVAPVFD